MSLEICDSGRVWFGKEIDVGEFPGNCEVEKGGADVQVKGKDSKRFQEDIFP